MKHLPLPLLVLLTVTLLAHVLTATHYPMFRDEFYYLDCANHLDWGYVDHPPLSIAVLDVWRAMFGDSLFAVRLLPALAAVALIWLTWKITEEFGGGTFACTLAGIAAFFSPQQRALTGFFSMNAFDLLFWAGAMLLLIRIVKQDDARLWIPFGILVGLGLMNKISLLYFGAGLVAGMIFTPLRKYFLKWQFWAGGVIALVIFLPYVLWQFSHDFATLQFIHNATTFKNAAFAPQQFLAEFALENNPLTVVVWIAGILALSFWQRLRPFRFLGWLAAIVFLILMTQKGKPYYAAGVLPLLMAAGAVYLESRLPAPRWTWVRAAYVGLLIAGGAVLLPFGLRILSPEAYIHYQSAIGIAPKPSERGHMDELWPQHYADSFGWEELVKMTADAYRSLSADERKDVAIVARNYGQAGAMNYYGRAYGLPSAYSLQNNYWFWGPPKVTPNTTYIIVRKNSEPPNDVFDSTRVVGAPDNPFAMPYERNNVVYVCKSMRIGLADIWRKERDWD